MSTSAYDLKQFYSSRAGRLVRRLLANRINEFWPDLQDKNVMGYGYTFPYLTPMTKQAQRAVALMSTRTGVHPWPEEAPSLVSLTGETELPFENEYFDRILVVHGLEYAENPEMLIHEYWRVLKSNGRLLMEGSLCYSKFRN